MPILRWLFEVENKVEDKALLILDYIYRKKKKFWNYTAEYKVITIIVHPLKNETVTLTYKTIIKDNKSLKVQTFVLKFWIFISSDKSWEDKWLWLHIGSFLA